LESDGKTPEAVLLAWSIIEMYCDNIVPRICGISSQNTRSKPLTNLRVSDKLKLFRQMELLYDTEFDVIQQFKTKRDGLFHQDGLFFPNYTEAEKHELTDKAIAAVDVMHNLSDRALKIPSPYSGKPTEPPKLRF